MVTFASKLIVKSCFNNAGISQVKTHRIPHAHIPLTTD